MVYLRVWRRALLRELHEPFLPILPQDSKVHRRLTFVHSHRSCHHTIYANEASDRRGQEMVQTTDAPGLVRERAM